MIKLRSNWKDHFVVSRIVLGEQLTPPIPLADTSTDSENRYCRSAYFSISIVYRGHCSAMASRIYNDLASSHDLAGQRAQEAPSEPPPPATR
jgi:hypothetical protein